MSDQDDPIGMDQLKFVDKVNQWGEWINAAYQANDLAECRKRTEAALLWFQENRINLSANIQQYMDSMLIDMRQKLAQLPKSSTTTATPCPGVDPSKSLSTDAAQVYGDKAVKELRNLLPQLDHSISQDIQFCLDASYLQPVPDSRVTCDHLLAFALREYVRAVSSQDASRLTQASMNLVTWAQRTGLNPGYRREDVARIISTLLNPKPNDSSDNSSDGMGCLVGILSIIGVVAKASLRHQSLMAKSKPWIRMLEEMFDSMENIDIF